MKSIRTITALLTLLASSSCLAATLTIPMSFEYLAIDGQKIKTNIFTHKADLQLQPGSHKIAIRYSDMVEDDYSDSEYRVESSPFIVTLDVNGDYQYHLLPVGGIPVKDPNTFSKSPKVIIKRGDNGAVDYQVKQTDFTEESFVSQLFTRNKQDIDPKMAATAATSKGNAAPIPQPQDPITHATSNNTTSTQSSKEAQKMLKYWWEQADAPTRKAFMGWAIQQM
ncbi:DUF2057 domain-containing protein [Shewanella surugensis]|uniref:DUF2057 domain-containing protein n=1 Tax=Shewanella surugensis TaxID=212020 RepID=A0ABT0L890_9GAMM|nr:DUF2057 domain-containing protein [Shewanella surugensis]MCL1123916.1 DUF2057 domain-containing protein [Shewanella surugensis]